MGELKASCCWEMYYILQILIVDVLYISGTFAEYISAKQILRQKVYPRKWCSLSLFIEMLSLLGGEFLGRVFLSVHLYNICLDGWSP